MKHTRSALHSSFCRAILDSIEKTADGKVLIKTNYDSFIKHVTEHSKPYDRVKASRRLKKINKLKELKLQYMAPVDITIAYVNMTQEQIDVYNQRKKEAIKREMDKLEHQIARMNQDD